MIEKNGYRLMFKSDFVKFLHVSLVIIYLF